MTRRTKGTWGTERLPFDGSFQGQPTVIVHRTHDHAPVFRHGTESQLATQEVSGSIRCGRNNTCVHEKDSDEQVTPALVMRERRHKMMLTMLFPRQGLSAHGSEREQPH